MPRAVTGPVNGPRIKSWWEWLESTEVTTSVTSVDFTSLNATDYDVYHWQISSLTAVSTPNDFEMRVGTGATPTWQSGSNEYYNAEHYIASGTDAVSANLDTKAAARIALSNGSLEAASGWVQLSMLDDTNHSIINWHVGATDGALVHTSFGSSSWTDTTAITGFRFFLSGGNIDGGMFSMYGLRRGAV